MSEAEVVSIKIENNFPLFGDVGDTLEKRLRKVTLRGFPGVRIYESAQFRTKHLSPEQIHQTLHTPQPTVYRTHLDRVNKLASLFAREGVDIFHLNQGYDYIATDSNGVETNWTMAPPIVERWTIPRHRNGGFDYSGLIGEELSKALEAQNLSINERIMHFPFMSHTGSFDLINDGSHRIHAGFEKKGVTVMMIDGVTEGYPYYAIPQHYSVVHVVPNRSEADVDLKVHVVEAPGHKNLYRLFPSGGIKSGDVRPLKQGEVKPQ